MRRTLAAVLSIPLFAFGLATSLVVAAGPASGVGGESSDVFINEFHYDNTGGDVGEFFEIAGPAGTDLTGWSVVLYNGSNGSTYNTIALTDTIDDEGTGAGAIHVSLPANGLQNGSADGIALIDNTAAVVQFLSYEGSFAAVGGPADGLTSTDIGVSEPGTTPIGESLQLIGTGTTAGDFNWTGPAAESPGSLNAGQTYAVVSCDATAFINEFHYDNAGSDVGEFVEIAGPAGTDLTGWSVVLYNGNGGGSYGTIDLSAETIDDEGTGSGAVSVARAGIQNGSPDGLALVDNTGAVIQFLSYEGSFTAADGPAAGLSSTDIGTSEPGTTAIGDSLQLTGTGTTAGDFAWTGPAAESPGSLNVGQTYDCGSGGPGPEGGLLISQYVEGSGFNKAIELRNRSTSAIDLSTVTVELFSNGSGTPSQDITLAGTLDPGAVHVIAHGSADPLILSVADTVSSAVMNFNGDDALRVSLDGTPIDVFGEIGTDPGTQWSGGGVTTQNESLCRLDSIVAGNPAGWSDPSLEFTGAPSNTFDGLGAADCSTVIPPISPCIAGTVFIHEIQGSGSVSPCVGDSVTVTGIVTALFQRDDTPDAFFLQEEDADNDADPQTSEGIFVFCRNDCPAVAPGDSVTVTGDVDEFFGTTQIDAAFGDGTFVINSTGGPLPTPTPISLPAAGSTLAEDTFESTEGMLVTFPSTLVVSEYFELARYGQIVLTEGSRPYQYTHTNVPDVAGFNAYLADLATRRIILDDDNNDQNDAIFDGPDEAYYQAGGGLTTTNIIRGGDTIAGLTAVMHWSFAGQGGTDAWRLRPIPQEYSYEFTEANPRTAAPDDVGGRLTVASFNVLNYFTTIDDGNNNARGAHSEAERQRQLDKIVAAMIAIDADVVGVVEIENNADASLISLVDGLNAVAGAGTYDYVDTGTIGTDAIKVGLIYQPANVTPVGPFAILDSSVDPRFNDDKNRPMLTQTFMESWTGALVTVSVNHLKSKGSPCDDVGDPGTGDGSGNCNGIRTDAAAAIADFLAGDPTGMGDPDHLVIGDLNAYKMETPITTLEAAGYTDLIELLEGPDAYSFVFSGQLGYLDYAMANDTLLSQVTGVDEWHINADEVNVLDYNDDIRDAGEASFERISETPPTYVAGPYRSSDHDPVIVGLALTTSEPSYECAGRTVTVSGLEAMGYNVIVGTEDHQVLLGTHGADAILGLGGNDTIIGRGGDDLLCGGAGVDLLLGGKGDDTLDGGSQYDLAIGGRGTDTCYGVEFAISCEL